LCRILNNEIYAKVKTGKHLSSEFKVHKGLRQGDATAPALFNVVMETVVRRSKVETQGNIFDRCSQILACVDGVVIMGTRLQDVEKVFTSLVEETKMGLEIKKRQNLLQYQESLAIKN
jgi:Reverse transcriptase (RNA-dependent DNA polymerase).